MRAHSSSSEDYEYKSGRKPRYGAVRSSDEGSNSDHSTEEGQATSVREAKPRSTRKRTTIIFVAGFAVLLVLGIIAAVVFTSNGNPSGASSSSTMGGGGAFSDVIIKTTAIAEVNSAASSTAHQAATSVTRTYDGRSTTNTSTSSVGSTATQHAPTLTINDASAQPTNKTTSSSSGSDGYWSKTYSGVGTHFPGATSALSCGDVYPNADSDLFAALCHSLYDSAPGTMAVDEQNRSPVCGEFVAGRKNLVGDWIGAQSDNWVIVGGDDKLNCVGTEKVRCHVPRTVKVTYSGQTITGVKIVDRNQGIEPSPCDEGDLDLSSFAYLQLAQTGILSDGLKGISWTWE